MTLFPSLFHHSGGAIYHWRALFGRKKLWKGHRQSTLSFLKEWNPTSRFLYLVGPSGGYSLPKEWLQKFTAITAFEPDPMARKIFEWRTGTRPLWIKEPFDFEALRSGKLKFENHSAILFCNLLGQLHFDQDSGMLAQNELLKLSQTHELASYHDILSGDDFRFEWSSPMDGDQPVRVKYDVEAFDPYLSPMKGKTELDLHIHPAAYLFQEEQGIHYQYWEWRITPTQTQVIEGVYFAKSQDGS